jgi:YidC/Oxa1 family membrane protein insertase
LGLDYETIPNFYIGKTNLAETPSLKNFSILCIIPFIAAGAQWVSMWLTRKFNGNSQMQMQDAQTQASMKIMDFMFPAMTLFMAFSFSAMLGLYWIYQTSLGLLQAFILSRVMPLPKYSEEELKSMRKAQKDAEKAQREAAKSQPKYRSLHYIDDDDYDVLPDAPKSEESKSTRMDGEIPEIKD